MEPMAPTAVTVGALTERHCLSALSCCAFRSQVSRGSPTPDDNTLSFAAGSHTFGCES